jgi:hypothetical protein
MNRFLIECHPDAIAKSLCDKHIVKMPLEEAQMLCTSLWHHAPEYAEEHGLYKPVHQKHPCTLWAMKTRANYVFAYSLYTAMLCEYNHRYGKWHGAGKHTAALHNGIALIPEGALTPHPQCFSGHDDLKTDERWPIMAYRAFYIVDKAGFARYDKGGRTMPNWMKEGIENGQGLHSR